jgi:hypothetical protein
MLSKKSWLTLSLAAVFLVAAGCTGGDLDDPTSADVFVQVIGLENQPVTANQSTPAQGTCANSGNLCDSAADCALNEACLRPTLCIFEVIEWTAILQATPKNSLAVGPYNDVIMERVVINYSWPDTGFTTPTRTFGLGGVSIPADGSNSVSFFPILGQDLQLLDQGITGSLLMTFYGRTVEGSELSGQAQAELYIETCNN